MDPAVEEFLANVPWYVLERPTIGAVRREQRRARILRDDLETALADLYHGADSSYVVERIQHALTKQERLRT